MPEECIPPRIEKLLPYILAGAGITLVAFLFYRTQFKPQSLSLSSEKINSMEEEIYNLKDQLIKTQEELKSLSQFEKYKLQQSKSQPLLPLNKSNDSRQNKERQMMFNMV